MTKVLQCSQRPCQVFDHAVHTSALIEYVELLQALG